MNDRIEWIDAAKGIAILMVMSLHLMQYLPRPDWLFRMFFLGAMGVQLFFILSAYCLCMTWKPERFDGWYWWKKYKRLAPWYFLGIVLYAAYWAFISKENGIGYYTVKNVLLNVFFLNGFVEEAQNKIVPGGWSISCIALFVFVFPFFAFMKRGLKVTVLSALSIIFSGIMAYGYLRLGWDRCFTYYHPCCQFGVFAFGVFFWEFRCELKQFISSKSGGNVVSVIGTATFLLCVAAFFFDRDMALIYRQYLMSVSFACGLLLLQDMDKAMPRWLGWLGRHSYELFILHFIIIWIPLR